MHLRQQRCAGERHQDGPGDHGDTVPGEEPIGRRQRAETHPIRLAGRVEDAQQCREQRDGRDKRDDHAGAGDLTQFRHAPVHRRQEAEEAHRGARSHQRQGTAGLRCRAAQGGREVVQVVPLGPVAHAELDAKIGAEADE